MLLMPDDQERRRSRNAKRFLWVIVIGAVLVLGLILYTSLTAPEEAPRMPKHSQVQQTGELS